MASLFMIIFMANNVDSSGIDMRSLVFKLRGMPIVHVDLAERSYDVRVEAGSLCRSGSLIAEAELVGRRAAVISDDTVARLHGAALM